MRDDDGTAARHGEGERRAGPFRVVAQRLAEGGASAFVGVFNHLLRQNDWARARLAMFAQRRVSIALEAPSVARLAPPPLVARITDDGLLDTSERGEPAPREAPLESPASGSERFGAPTGEAPPFDVEMHVRPSFAAAAALLREGTRGLAPYVRIEGEVMLAAALAEVAERMRWDPEEDLSRVTGDVIAHRIGRGVANARDAMRELRGRFAGSAGRRFASATGTLVGREELESMRSTLDALEARVSSLDAKRRRILSQGAANEPAQADEALAPQLLPPLELPRLDVDPGASQPQSGSSDDAEASGDPAGSARHPDPGAAGSRLG